MLQQMFPTVLMIHSYWRWAVLATALFAIVIAALGLAGKWSFAPWGRKAGVLFVTALDMQLLIGLLLYAASPLVRMSFSNMAAAMKIHEQRFFTVEHSVIMLLAVALAHVGAVRAKRAPADRAKFRQMLIWYVASLAAILAGIPWWRPLLRGLINS